MQVQVNTDAHIEGTAAFTAAVEATVREALERFEPQLTRVEVFLSDENSHKEGQRDTRCVVEARLSGLEPIAAGCNGATVDQALDEAIEKVERQIDKTIGRLGQRKGRTSFAGDPDSANPSGKQV